MNIIFCVILICSIIMICLTNPESVVGVMLDGTASAVKLTVNLVAIYSLWMGIMNILSSLGLDKKLSKLLSPAIGKVFKGETDEVKQLISLNLTANFLGFGGASTPLGIEAMSKMGKDKKKISKNMLLFFIINVTSVQLLPTTVITLRASMGSQSPSNIILPSILASTFTTTLGVLGVLLIEKVKVKLCEKRELQIFGKGNLQAIQRGKSLLLKEKFLRVYKKSKFKK